MTLRRSMVAGLPAFAERLSASRYVCFLTRDEARSGRFVPDQIVDNEGRFSLSPPQLCDLLGVEGAAGGTLAAIVFPVITGRARNDAAHTACRRRRRTAHSPRVVSREPRQDRPSSLRRVGPTSGATGRACSRRCPNECGATCWNWAATPPATARGCRARPISSKAASWSARPESAAGSLNAGRRSRVRRDMPVNQREEPEPRRPVRREGPESRRRQPPQGTARRRRGRASADPSARAVQHAAHQTGQGQRHRTPNGNAGGGNDRAFQHNPSQQIARRAIPERAGCRTPACGRSPRTPGRRPRPRARWPAPPRQTLP